MCEPQRYPHGATYGSASRKDLSEVGRAAKIRHAVHSEFPGSAEQKISNAVRSKFGEKRTPWDLRKPNSVRSISDQPTEEGISDKNCDSIQGSLLTILCQYPSSSVRTILRAAFPHTSPA